MMNHRRMDKRSSRKQIKYSLPTSISVYIVFWWRFYGNISGMRQRQRGFFYERNTGAYERRVGKDVDDQLGARFVTSGEVFLAPRFEASAVVSENLAI
jgi:hypothetical protein